MSTPIGVTTRTHAMQAGASTLSRRALGLLLCGLLGGQALAAPQTVAPAVGEINETDRVVLHGHLPRALATSQDLGPADPALPIERLTLMLKPSPAKEAALERFLHSVQRRGDPEFHRWLTPEAFEARFGVAATDRARLKTWLRAHRLSVTGEPTGGRLLHLSGTAGAIDEAFGTHLHRYSYRGELHLASATEPSVPRALVPIVQGFASLHDFRRQPQVVRGRRVGPSFDQGSGVYDLAPGDFATIYDLNPVYAQSISGNGRTIAVLGRSAISTTDLSTFRSTFGLSATLPTVVVNGTNPGIVTLDELESDLDLEWSAAIAPQASIVFVTSKSTTLTDGIDLSATYAVTNNVADVISLSYGSCESETDVASGTTFYNQLWQQAAAQGTSVVVGSGDSGAAGCDAAGSSSATHGLGVNALCTSPYSTCVGGTQFSADVAAPASYWSASNNGTTRASALGYIPEAVWDSGTSVLGSGGGRSLYFAKPWWQYAPGVPSDGVRDVPDLSVSASSSHDAYLVYTSAGSSGTSLIAIGGTSAAAPSIAGVAALIVQSQGGRIGNLNPYLYALSTQQVAGGAAVFHRITTGNNSVPGQAGYSASSADPTYNLATGLGSIDGALLIANIGRVSPGTVGLTPASVTVPAGVFIGSTVLTTGPTTAWTATSNVGWLTVTPVSGTGTTPLSFTTSANGATSSRVGQITVAGQVLTVTQAAAGAGGGALSVSSGALNFGSDTVGQATATQQFLVSNTGSGSVVLGSLSVSGPAAGDYVLGGSCAAGLTLSAGASCYVTVSFDATTTGARSASLSVVPSGGTATNVTLTGTGVAAAAGPPSDGPIPLWSYGLLGLGFFGIARRRLVRR